MKFLHSMIRVADVDKSLKFYKELLGLNLLSQSDLEDCTLYFLGEDENLPQIELTYNWETPKEGYKNGNAFGHFAFEVDDMQKFTQKADELGYEFMYGGPFDLDLKKPDGSIEVKKIAFLADPDGNEIEIIEKN